jgi:hypothetical protein
MKKRLQLSNSTSFPPREYRAIAPKSTAVAASRSLRKREPAEPKVEFRRFEFEALPEKVRHRIYYFLGYSVSYDLKFSTDALSRTRSSVFSLKQLYKVDLTSDKKLSVPWNVSLGPSSLPKLSANKISTNATECRRGELLKSKSV